MERRLSAILAADVAGYCRLMSGDDIGTLERLKDRLTNIVYPRVAEHSGAVFKEMGDGLLAEFPSAVGAVSSAMAIQSAMAAANAAENETPGMDFRIGVHLGEILEDGDDRFGDGVNLAARLQVVTDPGGVWVSASVFDHVRSKLSVSFEDMGEQAFRSFEEPMRAYRVAGAEVAVARPTTSESAGLSGNGSSPEALIKLPVRPSIAILPFRDLGGSSPDECLADGLRLGIQTMLVQLSGLFLINPSGVKQFSDGQVSPVDAGAELQVRYVLDGTVQKAGNRVRTIFNLTDIRNETVVWSERIDCDEIDLFALQDQVVDQVVTSMGTELFGGSAGFGLAQTLPGPRARELFFRSISHVYRGTQADNARARQLFRDLAAECPGTGHGIGNVALTHWLDTFFGWSGDPNLSLAKARDWADKALATGDVSGFGNTVNGNMELFAGHHDLALSFGQKAVSIRSSCPLSHCLLALTQSYSGDSAAAVKMVRYALHLEKVFPPWQLNILALAYRDSGQPDLAVHVADEVLRVDPENRDAALLKCSAAQMAGDGQKARETAEKVLRDEPDFRIGPYISAQPYRDRAMADRVAEALAGAGLPD